MTFDRFEELYTDNKIKLTGLWVRQEEDEFVRSYICPFIWNGKYYLARYTNRRFGAFSKGWKWAKSVKEFDTKQQANAYFLKCAEGYTKF